MCKEQKIKSDYREIHKNKCKESFFKLKNNFNLKSYYREIFLIKK